MLEFLISLVLDILAGTITGLIPGLHINLISASLLSYAEKTGFSPVILVIFIVAMSITHTFLDFIPSIFLGAPDEDTFLAVLPGHQMLREGKGHEAVILSAVGSFLGVILALLSVPLMIFLIPAIYQALNHLIPFILLFVSLYVIAREENPVLPAFIFLCSGFLGIFSFSIPNNQPILPLLSGLFGASSLIISLKNKVEIPKQELLPLKSIKIEKEDVKMALIPAVLISPFLSFLPGIGSGHSSFISSEIVKQTRKGFIILVSAINTIVMSVSFVALYAINRTRSGSALAIKQILGEIKTENLMIILLIIFISGLVSFIITIIISKNFAKLLGKVNYKILNIIILIIISSLTLTFSGISGLLILLTSTALGIFAISSKTKRINLMGSLILPTIIFYLTY